MEITDFGTHSDPPNPKGDLGQGLGLSNFSNYITKLFAELVVTKFNSY